MKRRDLEKEMTRLGWWCLRQSGRHDVRTDGWSQEFIPRHREVSERLACRILDRAGDREQ